MKHAYLLIFPVLVWSMSVSAQDPVVETPFVEIPQSPASGTEVPQPPTPADPPAGPAPTPEEFAVMAGAANLYAIAACETAINMLQDGALVDLARRFRDDHEQLQDALRASAETQDIRYDPELSADAKRKLADLESAPANQVDDVFLSGLMVEHQKALEVYALYGAKGSAGALKDFARNAYPKLWNHFQLARIESAQGE